MPNPILPKKVAKGICQNRYKIIIIPMEIIEKTNRYFLRLFVKAPNSAVPKMIDLISSSPFLNENPDSKNQKIPTEKNDIKILVSTLFIFIIFCNA